MLICTNNRRGKFTMSKIPVPKYTLVATIDANTIICTWRDDATGKGSARWYHPHCKIIIADNRARKTNNIHDKLNHALLVAIQDAHLRPSQLRYFRHDCGCGSKKRTSKDDLQHEFRQLSLFDEDKK